MSAAFAVAAVGFALMTREILEGRRSAVAEALLWRDDREARDEQPLDE
jgi:hypothetical protein